MSEATYTPGPFYSIHSSGKLGTYSFENDYVWQSLDEQLEAIAGLVWGGEWTDVIAIYLIDPSAGTCVDAMRELAEKMDAISRVRDDEPHADTAAFIDRVLKRPAWTPEREDEPQSPPALARMRAMTTHWGL